MQQNTADASRIGISERRTKRSGSGTPKADGAKSAMSFQAAEKARQMAREQQQMGARIDSLRQSAKELENRLKSAGALDTALSNRMRDIQKMLRDAMTPEMQKQLETLNKSTERLSGTEAQQSLEQLAQQQQQLRQQLEKSAEMLKRAALEGSMSTLRDEAKGCRGAEAWRARKQAATDAGSADRRKERRQERKAARPAGGPAAGARRRSQGARGSVACIAGRSRQTRETPR
jgi:hypothetical protein